MKPYLDQEMADDRLERALRYPLLVSGGFAPVSAFCESLGVLDDERRLRLE